MKRVLTMGEIMLRLKPKDHMRLLQAASFNANYGGSEANVAASLSLLGDQAAFLTKLPDNPLGQAALNTLRALGVDTSKILRGGSRLGIYFFEKGASVRPTNVVYDRAGSSFAKAKADEFNWPKLLQDTCCFYFSGITAALSPQLQQALLAACQYCMAHQITVVCDMNYRSKMWTPESAQAQMKLLLPYINVCIANDEDFEATLDIAAYDGNNAQGIEQLTSFEQAMKQVLAAYPNIRLVASVVRDIRSVEDSDWTALLVSRRQVVHAPIYHMHVFEGVAAGDAFSAGLLHGLVHDFDLQQLANYAIAASTLKLTISGDINLVSDADVKANMHAGSGMNR